MKISTHLLLALILMVAGWIGAFSLAARPGFNQGYWLLPALSIGAGIGFCLRHLNGRKTALILAVTAGVGMLAVNLLFPGNRVSLDGLRHQFKGAGLVTLPLRIDEQFRSSPFDHPLVLTSPLPLELSLFTRLPAGIDDFCFSSAGTLYASLPTLGAIYKVEQNPEGRRSEPQLFLAGLDLPTGLICDSTQIVVAEGSRISRYDQAGSRREILVDNLPADGGEAGHRLQRTPQGLLFSVGSRCDACVERDPRRGTVQRLTPEGRVQPYATGLRNTGGLVFDPDKNFLWASERSRRYPQPGAADELNPLFAGEDYGWPQCDGPDPPKQKHSLCLESRSAEILLRSRANPAGLMLTQQLAFPAVYRHSLLLVLQGDSANHVFPALVRIPLAEGRAASPVTFLGGWDGVNTRPSAVHPGPDRAIYIADDISGAIYRAAWQGGL